MKVYEAQILHSKDTIRRLYRAAYYTYEKKRAAFRFLVGAVMAAFGLLGNLTFLAQAILMMAGCWLLVSGDFPAKCRADRALEVRGKNLPVIVSSFYDRYVELSGEGQMKIPYDRFHYLAEDGQYLFMFISINSACMIDTQTLRPDSKEKFQKFVAEKTGLKWNVRKPLLMMSVQDLIGLVRK